MLTCKLQKILKLGKGKGKAKASEDLLFRNTTVFTTYFCYTV